MDDHNFQIKLPARPNDAHKGKFGKVLVIAGSRNYPGAAYLSAMGAYRVGAGLVTLAVGESIYPIAASKTSEVTYLILDEDDKVLGPAALVKIKKQIGDYEILVIGPGLGQRPQTVAFLKQLLKICNGKKLVIDADGLNILSNINHWWEEFELNAILTPHPGEFSRLTNLPIQQIQNNRESLAREYSQKWNQTILLKGSKTVIASDREIKVLPFENPVLATAGTGDILAGVIAGFLAQGLRLFDSALTGGYIHGLAGDLARADFGDTGVLASDLLLYLPVAINNLKKS